MSVPTGVWQGISSYGTAGFYQSGGTVDDALSRLDATLKNRRNMPEGGWPDLGDDPYSMRVQKPDYIDSSQKAAFLSTKQIDDMTHQADSYDADLNSGRHLPEWEREYKMNAVVRLRQKLAKAQ